jgi:hypothetical protein
MKGYSVKYALTTGITEVDVRAGLYDYVYTKRPQFQGHGTKQQLRVNKTFFEDRDEAVKVARAMAKKKVESLKKQLAKMESLAIEPQWKRPPTT